MACNFSKNSTFPEAFFCFKTRKKWSQLKNTSHFWAAFNCFNPISRKGEFSGVKAPLPVAYPQSFRWPQSGLSANLERN